MKRTAEEYRREIAELCSRISPHQPVRVMEVCGTHTMAIAAGGLRSLLPDSMDLISGPGCPVCVTDQSYVDRAIYLAGLDDVIIATYGDMVRVPGREISLETARAGGATVEVVYSPAQAVELAGRQPGKHVVFLAVGFETTAPATALAVQAAGEKKLDNFSVFTAHKLIMPAMQALLASGDVQLDAMLCPGHVSVIIGYRAYDELVSRFNMPCVVAGFDTAQILAALAEICRQLADEAPKACTVYPAVSADGNPDALKLLEKVFEPADALWRAIGNIPGSALVLRDEFAQFDTAKRFDLPDVAEYHVPGCRCGDVIRGVFKPTDCSLFANGCTPRKAVGPCMVSSEGACAAEYKYSTNKLRADSI